MSATGRPSTYTRDLADSILTDIAAGEMSLRHACAQHGVAPGTFCGWVVDDIDGLSERYRRARQIRAHGRVDEMYEIADNASKDFSFEEGRLICDREAIARSQLRVSVRQWELARMLRNEFGDKVEVGGTIGIDVAGAAIGLAEKLGGGDPARGPEGAAPGGAGEGAAD